MTKLAVPIKDPQYPLGSFLIKVFCDQVSVLVWLFHLRNKALPTLSAELCKDSSIFASIQCPRPLVRSAYLEDLTVRLIAQVFRIVVASRIDHLPLRRLVLVSHAPAFTPATPLTLYSCVRVAALSWGHK